MGGCTRTFLLGNYPGSVAELGECECLPWYFGNHLWNLLLYIVCTARDKSLYTHGACQIHLEAIFYRKTGETAGNRQAKLGICTEVRQTFRRNSQLKSRQNEVFFSGFCPIFQHFICLYLLNHSALLPCIFPFKTTDFYILLLSIYRLSVYNLYTTL